MSEQHPGKAALNLLRKFHAVFEFGKDRADIADIASYVSDLEARLEKAEAERDGWQPIETAPKDGSSILCFVPLDTMGVPFNHRVLALRYEARKSAWLTDVYAFVPFEPTHWQPLPTPPGQGDEA